MMDLGRYSAVVTAATAMLLSAVAAAAHDAVPVARTVATTGIDGIAALPSGSGRDDLIKVCTSCHEIGTVTGVPKTADMWKATVTEMISRGAEADDATADRIVGYLTTHFGSTPQ